MDAVSIVVTIPILASLLLEALKWVVRRYFVNDPDYQFSLELYGILLPLLQLVAAPLLLWTGFIDVLPSYIDFSSGVAVLRTVLTTVIQASVSVFYYNTTLGPIKTESKVRNLQKQIEKEFNNQPDEGGAGE